MGVRAPPNFSRISYRSGVDRALAKALARALAGPLEPAGADDADKQGEAEDGGKEEAHEAEDVHAEQPDAGLAKDAEQGGAYYEGGDQDRKDQPVRQDVDF